MKLLNEVNCKRFDSGFESSSYKSSKSVFEFVLDFHIKEDSNPDSERLQLFDNLNYILLTYEYIIYALITL